MFTVVITEKGGGQRRLTFGEPEVTIGRVPGNDVVLPKGNVSKRHSRIVLKDNRFIVVDLKSTNGTYVNGRKITSPLVVKEGDKIYIGDFVLTLEGNPAMAAAAEAMRQPSLLPSIKAQDGSDRIPTTGNISSSAAPPLPSRAPEPMLEDPLPAVLRSAAHERPSVPPSPAPVTAVGMQAAPSVPPVIGGPASMSERPPVEQTNVIAYTAEESTRAEPGLLAIPPAPAIPSNMRSVPPVLGGRSPSSIPAPGVQPELRALMVRLGRDFDLDNVEPSAVADERRWQRAERAILAKIGELVAEGVGSRPLDRSALAKAALLEAVGLGALDALLADPNVFHIVIERFDRIRADRGHGLTPETAAFSSPQALLTVVRRLCAQAGITGTPPDSCDLSLPSGLHVVAVLPSAASEGPVLSVRRRPTRFASLNDRKNDASIDPLQLRSLTQALSDRRPVWIVGPSGADLAGVLASVVAGCPPNERVALFERAPEVALGERSAVCFKLGSASIASLLERVRHFRPDRLVAHDLREDELAVVLGAFARRHDGSIASLEHKSVKEALSTLERAGGADLVLRAAALIVELAVSRDSETHVSGVYELELDASGALQLKQ